MRLKVKGETITLLLICAMAALIILALFSGCGQPIDPAPMPVARFKRGDVVILKIDGRGQILRVFTHPGEDVRYKVRVRTEDGPDCIVLYEFELEPQKVNEGDC
jgi:hypothetical protein